MTEPQHPGGYVPCECGRQVKIPKGEYVVSLAGLSLDLDSYIEGMRRVADSDE